MNILKKLVKKQDFTVREQYIADFILKNTDKLENISSRMLAKETFTSTSVIIRFCKKMGYSGYNDFKMNIISDLKLGNSDQIWDEAKIDDRDSMLTIVNKITELEKAAIDKTRANLSMSQLARIWKLLNETTYIDLFAYDMNISMTEYACHIFSTCGKMVSIYDGEDRNIYTALNCPKDHMAILISRTGTNKKILNIAQILKKRKIPTIGITHYLNTPFAKFVDEPVFIMSVEPFSCFSLQISATSIKYILDTFANLIYLGAYERVEKLEMLYEKARDQLLN